MKKINYNWEILALTRFILAVVVLLEHIPSIFKNSNHIMPWYSKLGAFEAVLGFLLISGLSIGKSLERNRSTFFKRRLQRIYPVYIVSIFLQYAVQPYPLSADFLFIILLNLVFLNQIFTTRSFIIVAWSLSLEIWLYTLAPLLYKFSLKALMALIYASFGAFLLYTVGRTRLHWPYYTDVTYGLTLLLFSFIWIAGFAYSIYPEKRKFLAINVALFFVAYMVLTIVIQSLYDLKHHKLEVFFSNELIFFALQFICLIFVYLVVFFNNYIPAFSIRTKKVLNLLGNISYPLYLTHRSVFIFFRDRGIVNPLISIFSSIMVAFLVYWIFDFYSKKWIRDKTGSSYSQSVRVGL